jgi:hypothetical protein
MVFFQATLLAGYAYAHATSTWIGVRRQTLVQAGLVLLPLFVLPFAIPADAAESLAQRANPTGWLLKLLFSVIGLPFFVVSTSAPLLQRWFSRSGHPAASDPYFLYGPSNVGSMLALVAYPLLVEPNFRLAQQSTAWTAGYGLFVALTLACATIVSKGRELAAAEPRDPAPREGPAPLEVGRILHWVVLAFIPSSLMLGVTMYLTTDIAAIPLLWVIPLALYLLTFVLTFARRPLLRHSWMVRALPMAVVVLSLSMSLSSVTQVVFLPVHLLTFFLAAMVCHGELVRYRPAREHLTAFYLAISCGGVAGGLFNALVAPVVFDRVAEYPLALVLACLVLPGARSDPRNSRRRLLDLALPTTLGALTWMMILLVEQHLKPPQDEIALKCVLGVAVIVCYTFKDRPVRFALGTGAVLLAGGTYASDFGRVLYQHRNYFGVLRVTDVTSGNYHRLIHGQTLHGQQSLDPARRREPLTYYHHSGPIGQVFDVLQERLAGSNVAIVGLGAGSLGSYAQPGQSWAFYELDPVVAQVARDARFFTFLDDSHAASTEVILGDARLSIRYAPEEAYQLLVLDAFSSDSIPTHLLTREALRLYLDKLAAGGVIAFHVSSNFIDLTPVLGALARDAGLACLVRRDLILSREDLAGGKSPSVWGVMARQASELGVLVDDSRWAPPPVRDREPVWTDDFSNIVAHLIVRGDH